MTGRVVGREVLVPRERRPDLEFQPVVHDQRKLKGATRGVLAGTVEDVNRQPNVRGGQREAVQLRDPRVHGHLAGGRVVPDGRGDAHPPGGDFPQIVDVDQDPVMESQSNARE